MTDEELLQEFLEASKLDKEDVEYYQHFKQISYDGKLYKAEGLFIKLKKLRYEITYFHYPNEAIL